MAQKAHVLCLEENVFRRDGAVTDDALHITVSPVLLISYTHYEDRRRQHPLLVVIDRADFFAHLVGPDHDEVPRLFVGPGRREPGRFNETIDLFVGNLFVGLFSRTAKAFSSTARMVERIPSR